MLKQYKKLQAQFKVGVKMENNKPKFLIENKGIFIASDKPLTYAEAVEIYKNANKDKHIKNENQNN